MLGPFTKFEVVFFAVYAIIILDLCLNWSDYNSCQAPIDFFLLATYLIIPTQAIIWTFMGYPRTPAWLSKLLTVIFFAVLGPGFFFLTIIGIKFQIEDIDDSPECVPEERAPWTIWGWIVLLVFEDLVYTAIIVFTVISWYQWLRYIRRMRALTNNITNMDGRDLNEYLLGLDGEYGDLNNQVGIDKKVLDQLQTTSYTQNFGDLLTVHQPSCPICFEDFNTNENVVSLPSCEHLYHTKCIKTWLVKNPLCPMCRSNVRNSHYRNSLVQNDNQEQVEVITVL